MPTDDGKTTFPGPPVQVPLADTAERLEVFYGVPLSEIPDEKLREVASKAVFPFPWDALSSDQRKQVVAQNFGEPSGEFREAFAEASKIADTEHNIKDMELMPARTPDELRTKREDLAALRGKREDQIAAFNCHGKKEPADMVAELKAKGKENWEIAGALLSAFNISTYKLGELLPAKPGTTIAHESISKRGRELKKLWENKGIRTSTKNPKQIR